MPTYVMPGMPLVFFVSGGLAYQSLRLRDGVRRAARVYWRKTYRRLLLPYWSFYAVVVVVAVVGDLVSESPKWMVRWGSVLLGATGLVIPKPSPAVSGYIGHLWFMSAFSVLVLAAPGLVRWFERSRSTMFAALFAAFALVQWLDVSDHVSVPSEIDRLSLFAIFYCVGMLYTDGVLAELSTRVAMAFATIAAAGAWLSIRFQPVRGSANDSKHLFVGLCWLFLALAGAPGLRRLADRWDRPIGRINRRSFTAYLWGWPTCSLAAEWSEELIDGVWAYRLLMSALSVLLLGAAVLLFGPVEDLAAGRITARRSGSIG